MSQHKEGSHATPACLPCPFCGNKQIIFDDTDNLGMTGAYGWFAVCDATGGSKPGCGASSGWNATQEGAASEWNRRCARSESERTEIKKAVGLLTRWHSQGMISTGEEDEMPPSLMKDTVEFVKRNKEYQ